MNKIYIYYHIFIETNWYDIVLEQLERLHNSGLLNISNLKIGVVFGYGIDRESNIIKLNNILENFYNYEIMFMEPNGCCGESSTLKELSNFSKTNDENYNILYLHTKGITQYQTEREEPVREWRKMMEYFLIDKWEDCLEKLNEGYDCCGINYQNHAANIKNESKLIQIFNGNFFWVNSNYAKKLDDTILFEHRYSAENWILSSEHKSFSFLDVPPAFNLYYNIYENYKTINNE
jgi:hypothetical protein